MPLKTSTLFKTAVVTLAALGTAPALAADGFSFSGAVGANYNTDTVYGNSAGISVDLGYGFALGSGEAGIGVNAWAESGSAGSWSGYAPFVYYSQGNTRIDIGYIEAAYDVIMPETMYMYLEMFNVNSLVPGARITTQLGNTRLGFAYMQDRSFDFAASSRFSDSLSASASIGTFTGSLAQYDYTAELSAGTLANNGTGRGLTPALDKLGAKLEVGGDQFGPHGTGLTLSYDIIDGLRVSVTKTFLPTTPGFNMVETSARYDITDSLSINAIYTSDAISGDTYQVGAVYNF